MFINVLAIITIILVIFLLCYTIYNSDMLRRRRSRTYTLRSTGGYDTNARDALRELSAITNKTAADTFNYANILRYNVLENRLRPNQHYNDGVQLAAPDQHRVVRLIHENYANTLAMLGAGAVQLDINDPFGLFQVPAPVGPDFMLERIEELLFGPGGPGDETGALQDAHRNVAQQRLDAAAAAGSTRAEVIDTFLDKSVQYTEDTQNVHDSGVNNDLRNILAIIRETYDGTPAASIAEARKHVGAEALVALNKIAEGHFISTYGEREDYVFSYVWERAKIAENTANAELIREAIVAALTDSTEDGHLVCINGRCARLLNALTLLDFRPEISSVMNSEAYRNQIYEEVKVIIDQLIADAVASPDADLRKVGENYQNGELADDTNPVERAFKLQIRNAVDERIDMYAGKVQKKSLDAIREDCYMVASL